jgi:MFS transporter, DHA1 family, inner membrane transport protein
MVPEFRARESDMPASQTPRFTRPEWQLLLILAAVQFVNLLDFVIMMPLAPRLIKLFEITPAQFGTLVSSYGIAAALAGVLAALCIDRFDRRNTLIFLLAGFTLGTLGCGLAPDYQTMLIARIVAGLFGGVLGSVVLAIVGDRFLAERRGAAMGVVMSSFAIASVAGVPLGLLLADTLGPFVPFQILAAASLLLIPISLFILPPMNDHLKQQRIHPMHQFQHILGTGRYLLAYLFSITVVGAGFFVIPFLAAYLVQNVGTRDEDVKYVYLVAGACTLVSMNVIGRLSDRFGKVRVFRIVAFGAMLSSLALTHLPAAPLGITMLTCACFMVFTSGRVVPAQALITGVAPPHERGGFMSLNSAVQHGALGVAAWLTGLLVSVDVNGRLTGYDHAGYVAAALAVFSMVLVAFLRAAPTPEPVKQLQQPLTAEAVA